MFFKSLFIIALLGTLVRAETRYGAWAIYWDTAPVHAAYGAHQAALSTLRMFAYHFNEAGDVLQSSPWVSATREEWKKMEGKTKKRYLLTFVNDVVAKGGNRLKDPGIVRRMIETPESRKKHIDQILEASLDFDGVEIDYENMYVADRSSFTLLIQELAAAVHERKQWLSVVVEPKTQEVDYDGPGAADWTALAAIADELTIMAYYRHHVGGPAGPLAPADWVFQIAQYALTQAPASKVTLAFCVDAIEWSSEGDKEIQWAVAEERRKGAHARIERPGLDRSVRFTYEISGVKREVWMEDAESLKEKIQIASRAGVSSISFWRLGSGDPAFWKRLSRPVQRGTVKYKK